MLSHAKSADILQSLLADARRLGADACDARLRRTEGLSVEVRNGELEQVEREEGASIALRALVGKRQANVSGSDLSPAGLKALAERVVAMARAAPEDKWCGIPDASELARDLKDLQLETDDDADAAALERRAAEAEAAALAVTGVKQVSRAVASWDRGQTSVAASNGFSAGRSSGHASISVTAIAERDGAMERDYEGRTERRRAQMPPPAEIGRIAAGRAVARLGGRKIASRTAPVIFENRVADDLLGAFINAISGPMIARGTSFLKDRMGQPVFAKGVDIIDDPLRLGGYASRAHDGEGRPVGLTKLIDDGVLTQWMLSGPSARQLGLTPNGFSSLAFGDPPGVSASNMDIAAGPRSLDQLMADAGEGLLVSDMFGPSLNPNTGDYSVGVSGFWFADGARQYPVTEVTVAGDLISMFARAIPASDLEIRGGINSPSLLIDGLSIAGT